VTVAVTFEDWFAITQFYARYASVVDAADWDRWPEMFTEDCIYRLQPRENHERGLPLATLAFTSRGMLLDRVYSIKDTLFHDPYYQRHIISSPVVHVAVDGIWECEANYAVFRTKLSDTTTVFNVGRSFDTIVRTDGGLHFSRRECIYDSEMIPNSIIYPV
jgi:salicylate 5-hydroxylase small subunit